MLHPLILLITGVMNHALTLATGAQSRSIIPGYGPTIYIGWEGAGATLATPLIITRYYTKITT